jgi:phage-related protein
MERAEPLQAVFFESESGNQPVRDFLLERTRDDRKEIGSDIFKVQQGFPMGKPFVEKIDADLWEVRSSLPDGICRVFFTVYRQTMILLHSFIKKTQKTPLKEIKTAKNRLQEFRRQCK